MVTLCKKNDAGHNSPAARDTRTNTRESPLKRWRGRVLRSKDREGEFPLKRWRGRVHRCFATVSLRCSGSPASSRSLGTAESGGFDASCGGRRVASPYPPPLPWGGGAAGQRATRRGRALKEGPAPGPAPWRGGWRP